MANIEIGSRVVFHGTYPWHDYYAVVIGEDPNYIECGIRVTDAWIVRWEGDQYFPERAETESRIPKYVSLNKFHTVAGGR